MVYYWDYHGFTTYQPWINLINSDLPWLPWTGVATQPKKNDNWCEIGTPQLSDYGGCLINMVQAWSSPTKLTNHFLAIPLCWILVFRAQMPSHWWNSRVACWSPTFFSMTKSEFGMVLTSPYIFACMFTYMFPWVFPCFPPLVPWKKRRSDNACHRPRRRPRSGASAQHRGTPRPTKRSPEETIGYPLVI